MHSRVTISVSIVTYHPDLILLNKVLDSLGSSLEMAKESGIIGEHEIFLVDNGRDFETDPTIMTPINKKYLNVKFLTGHGNVGYGLGNNLAFESSTGDYFVVLNPDVILEPKTMTSALSFMSTNNDCGLLAPAAFDHQGGKLSICKRYPSVIDLAVRGFLPRRLRKLFASRLAKYEMQDLLNQESIFWNPDLVSGCFMLFRREVFSLLQGFSPKYFMYFEDFDISIRTRKISAIAYVPSVKIDHYGGNASRKGLKHILMFCISAYRFFVTHGWQWI
ncbi:glycosyltransferase [Cylindrospermopsis raciborskii]|uniref:Glycosyl transferase n=2 Tax=Cylindrospermopsis raciborskii TaxID=77022 RepID=A0A853MIN0_9CYAN|nr:glycosyltransferase [Cylindrospermopsis raciborskii]EFA68185.1 Glycosyl transferase family 2 [Cylindrospermopsis raciborskii CS-505]OBU76958.1 glycosyl transferase [Cylindrospermopsis raciborskii CS-505]TPX27629.1 glycosyltransferase [Cylindrospermopsis raciborskii GIHE 2018]